MWNSLHKLKLVVQLLRNYFKYIFSTINQTFMVFITNLGNQDEIFLWSLNILTILFAYSSFFLADVSENKICEVTKFCAFLSKYTWHRKNSPLNKYYYTFKVHSRSLLVNILRLILNVRQLWRLFRRKLLWIIGRRCPKKYLGADDVTTSKRAKITK